MNIFIRNINNGDEKDSNLFKAVPFKSENA